METYSECILPKQQFIKIINKLEAADKLQDAISDLMNEAKENIENDFMNACGLMINHETIVIELLELLMKDNSDDISYYIYELNYGHDYEPGCITVDGQNIDFSNPGSLYDFLIETNFKQEEN